MMITPHLDINFSANQSCDVCRNEVQLALSIEPSDGFYGGTVCMTCLFLMRDQNLAVSDSADRSDKTPENVTSGDPQKQGGNLYASPELKIVARHGDILHPDFQAVIDDAKRGHTLTKFRAEMDELQAHLLLEIIHELRRARASQTYIYGEEPRT